MKVLKVLKIEYFMVLARFELIVVFFNIIVPLLSFIPRFRTICPCLRYRRLQNPLAANSAETIDPATYSVDLYKVLGVSPNATKKELRDAYWTIAFQNHPDRNNSQIALETFRNASYAYKILGKDDRSRSDYDKALASKQFIDVLGEVGSEIVIPLAMDVAVPLLNITMSSIKSFAFPYINDLYQQSVAVINTFINTTISNEKAENIHIDSVANMKSTTTGQSAFPDINLITKATKKAMEARELVWLEQQNRIFEEKLNKTNRDIEKVSRQLVQAIEIKNEAEVDMIRKRELFESLQLKSNQSTM